ncbi:MAG: hypothetical protein ACR2PR_07480 [Pseudohongiellaceae bacterium]
MTDNMRASCQILRQIEALKGTATTVLLDQLLPDIGYHSISAHISRMIRQDRVHKCGTVETGKLGKKGFYYQVNKDWEPSRPASRPAAAPARKKKKILDSNERQVSAGNMKVIRFRQEKIDLLQRIQKSAPYLSPKDQDLLIGLLADLRPPSL